MGATIAAMRLSNSTQKRALNYVPDALSRGFEVDKASFQKAKNEWYLKRKKKEVETRPKEFPNWNIEDGVLYRHK